MKTSQELTFNDLSREEGQLTTVDVNTLRPMPVDYQTFRAALGALRYKGREMRLGAGRR